MSIKIGNDEIQSLAIFERVTGTYPKDCINADDAIYFVVDKGKMGNAIGKGGSNVKRISDMLNKSVKLFEYSQDPQEMIKNMIPAAKSVEVKNEEAVVSVSSRDRSSVIGQRGRNIKIIKELLDRHFKIKNLRLK